MDSRSPVPLNLGALKRMALGLSDLERRALGRWQRELDAHLERLLAQICEHARADCRLLKTRGSRVLVVCIHAAGPPSVPPLRAPTT